MTPTKAEELAARLESGWCPIESPADMERAAAELRRLAALEVARDALQLDYARLLEKHNNLHAKRDVESAAAPVNPSPTPAPLTDEQIYAALDADVEEIESTKADPESWGVIVTMVRAIERAHGIWATTGEQR